jgi:23S rRNA (adenine2503-C2)-methyltransferase
MTSIPIFKHTQQSYAAVIYERLGKGREHAALVYAEWFRYGNVEGRSPAFKNALPLLQHILALTDFEIPALASQVSIEDVTTVETTKFLLRTHDALETESVLIPMQSGWTLCISSQVGCRMGCAFCETGKMGLLRHLSTEEIVAQVFTAKIKLKCPVRNIVLMGMGEPLDNYDNVMQAIRVLTSPGGLGFEYSHITLSTSGRVEEMYRLIDEADPSLNLAVSVNAPNDEVRRRLMPINRQHDMAALYQAMAAYCAHPRREILIEYVLISGYTDAEEHADQLAVYLRGLRVKINVIPYNPQSRDRFQPPAVEKVDRFVERLRSHGYRVLVRRNKGQHIMAACGQLGNIELRRQLISQRSNMNKEGIL